MPEKRTMKIYTYPKALMAAERVPGNALIEEVSYIVSDAQLLLEKIEKDSSVAAGDIIKAIDDWPVLDEREKDELLHTMGKLLLTACLKLGVLNL